LRRLVVTGDDFGASTSVNRAIAAAYEHGILTSASLIVSGDAADEAVEIARSHPGLAVGLHLVLADGRPVLPPDELPSLTSPDGRFRGSPAAAGWQYWFAPRARAELEREIRAQLEAFRATGLVLSHVDGHHHLHLHPVILDALLGLAAEFGIRWLRVPSEELGFALAADPRNAPRQILWSGVFGALRAHAARRIQAAGIGFLDRVYGLLMTGRVDERYLLNLIPRIQTQAAELYCHPCWPRNGAGSQDSPGARELSALLSQRVRNAVFGSGLVLSRLASVPLPGDGGERRA
jgi:hopanoid biosynthesis associated protein HpnK